MQLVAENIEDESHLVLIVSGNEIWLGDRLIAVEVVSPPLSLAMGDLVNRTEHIDVGRPSRRVASTRVPETLYPQLPAERQGSIEGGGGAPYKLFGAPGPETKMTKKTRDKKGSTWTKKKSFGQKRSHLDKKETTWTKKKPLGQKRR